MEPCSKMRGSRAKSAIISLSSAAPISSDETTLAISDKRLKGSWETRQVCSREKAAIAESSVAWFSGRDKASASSFCFPGI